MVELGEFLLSCLRLTCSSYIYLVTSGLLLLFLLSLHRVLLFVFGIATDAVALFDVVFVHLMWYLQHVWCFALT